MVAGEQELLAADAAYLNAMRSWFFNPGMEAPGTGDHQDYADFIREAVGHLGPQASWSFDNPLAAMRGADFGVLAGGNWLYRPGRAPHPMLILSAWRRENGEWRLHRSYEEVGTPEGPSADELLAVDADSVETWNACLQSGDPGPALIPGPHLRGRLKR